MRRLVLPGVLAFLLASAHSLTGASVSELTYARRVEAQRALQQVYYAHVSDTSLSFEEAVSEEILEEGVRTYLRQSSALDSLWKTPVTDSMLRLELQRMERGSRMPDRLRELKAALGDDPVLILECLARPALVDRMARGFFARDKVIHKATRLEAETIRDLVETGALDPRSEHPRRRVLTPGSGGKSSGAVPDSPFNRDSRNADDGAGLEERKLLEPGLSPGGSGGGIAFVDETPSSFNVRVPLGPEDGASAAAAIYTVPKRTWHDWWADISPDLNPEMVGAVATATPLPGGDLLNSCTEPGVWENGGLQIDLVDGRTGHVALWTGSLMLIWGAEPDDGSPTRGARYDPAIDLWTPISDVGAPSRRFGHSGVWTGTEMIVWGGEAEQFVGPPLDDGGRYDPVADRWVPLSTIGAPIARLAHTAVWTGNRMIVWGGRLSSSGFLPVTDTGGIYEPATDSWTPVPLAGAPSARRGHGAVWTGTELIIYGGIDGSRTIVPDGASYDPVAGAWSPLSTTGAPSPRRQFSTIWDGDRMIIWGGEEPGLAPVDTGGRYDPATDTWSPTSTLGTPMERARHTAIWTGDRMIVWGGAYGSIEQRTGALYDPVQDSWTPTATTNAPPARSEHSAIWTGDLMIVWGGNTPSIFNSPPGLSSGGRYDPATDSWTHTVETRTPAGRKDHVAVWSGHHMIIWGGRTVVDVPLGDGALYDPALDLWTPMSPVPFIGLREGRRNPAAVWTGDRLIVWGGLGVVENQATFADGFSYDPISDTVTPISTSGQPSPRGNHTAVWTGQKMIVYGGELFAGAFSPIPSPTPGGVYTPASDSWQLLPTAGEPGSRLGHSAVWSGTRMYVWGGEGPSGPLDTGASYSARLNRWAPIATAGAPPPGLAHHSAAWTGTEMIVWGGASSVNAGGRYDPAAAMWAPLSVDGAPTPRAGTPAVWTGREMIVWHSPDSSFGGRYDPAADTWLLTPTLGAPAGAGGGDHTAVWTGDSMIVWGGATRQPGTSLFSNKGGIFFPDRVTVQDSDGDGISVCDGDCDDADSTVYPGAPQVCDGVNNDCLDPTWPDVAGTDDADDDGDGLSECAGDCDDADPSIYPGAPQICDGINNDCLDPGWPDVAGTDEADDDGDGLSECAGDCDDAAPSIYPGGDEVCDLLDNDCDGATDEGLLQATPTITPSALGLASRGRGFSIHLEMVDSCNPSGPRLLHGKELDRAWISRAGGTVLPDPLSLPCPDNDSVEFERGLAETLSSRVTNARKAILRFETPSDGVCHTLEGDRADLLWLLAGTPPFTPAPVCIAGIAAGTAFEGCTEVTLRGGPGGNRNPGREGALPSRPDGRLRVRPETSPP